jgi:GNAT superfamily N-acetyltransferase
MQIGCITEDNLQFFRTLLLPAALDLLADGEALTALGLVQDEVACGAAAGHLTEDSFEIMSLYVAPDYRRKGGGRLLLDTYAELLSATPDATIHSMTISYTVTQKEHEDLMPFLTSMGFVSQKEMSPILRCTVGETTAAPFFTKNGETSSVMTFSEVPKSYLVHATKKAVRLGIPMPAQPFEDEKTEKDISVCMIENGEIKSLLSFDFSCDGLLTLSCAYSENPIHLPMLFRRACQLASKKYPPETPFAVQTVNSMSADLLQAVLPMAEVISFTYRRDLK